MNRTTVRRAHKPHRCSYDHCRIRAGALYLEHVYSPQHDDLGNGKWWRSRQCQNCAQALGKGRLFPSRLVTRISDGTRFEVLGLAPLEHEPGTPDRLFLREVLDDGQRSSLSYVKVPVPSFVADFTARPCPPSVHVPTTICQETT